MGSALSPAGLLRSGAPDLSGIPQIHIPYHSTIRCPRTSEFLERTPSPVHHLPARLLREDPSWS